MAEILENLGTILRDWAKDKVKDRAVSFLEDDSGKYLRSISRQSSKTKPSTKMVLVSRKPLLYLEFNKANKQNVYEINLFEKFNFSFLFSFSVDTPIS